MGHHLCLRVPDIHIQSNPKQNKIVKTSFQSQELPNGWSMSGAVLVALAIFLNGAKKYWSTYLWKILQKAACLGKMILLTNGYKHHLNNVHDSTLTRFNKQEEKITNIIKLTVSPERL